MYFDTLDELDNKILTVIENNARLTYKEIGEQIGISRVSVKKRMDELQEKGIILGFQTKISPYREPVGTRFFLDLEIVPESYNEVTDYLGNEKMVRQIFGISGECRIHATGFAPNSRQLEVFANNLYSSLHGVRKLSCHTVLSTIKDMDGGIAYDKHKGTKHLEEGRSAG